MRVKKNPVVSTALLVLLVIAGYVGAVAWIRSTPTLATLRSVGPGPNDGVAARPITFPSPFPPKHQDVFGVLTHRGPYDMRQFDSFTRAAGKTPSLMMFTQNWAHDPFRPSLFDSIARRGIFPIVSWEPWDPYMASVHASSAIQPRYRLANIVAGNFDGYIRRWAVGIRDLGYRVGIRFAHEMNGDWYPWGGRVNGNTPAEYVLAWWHVHNIFQQVGATNVTWIWAPNRIYTGVGPLRPLYPGDAYVNWVGLSGYGSPSPVTGVVPTPAEVYGPTIDVVRRFAARPIVLAEVGAQDGPQKPEWIREFFRYLREENEIMGFIWFDVDTPAADWRIESSVEAERAFAQGVSAAGFAAAPG